MLILDNTTEGARYADNLARHLMKPIWENHYLLFGVICLGIVLLKLLEQYFESPHGSPPFYYSEVPNYAAMVITGIFLFLVTSFMHKRKILKKTTFGYAVAIIGSFLNYAVFG